MSPFKCPAPVEISVKEAQQQIQQQILPIQEFETIDLQGGLDRILAADVQAPINVPAFDNAAMDGYALRAADLTQFQDLKIIGKSYAGHPYHQPLKPGQAIRITTGAPMPTGADSVLPEELAKLKNDTTLDMVGIPIKAGLHRRKRGEEIGVGSVALGRGKRLGPTELGLLAALGISSVAVRRTLRIAIFSTGDELQNPHQSLGDGAIYDSNRYTLIALAQQCGAQVVDLGILPDDPTVIRTALKDTINQVDVIITSGGVSGGAADFTKQVMQQLAPMFFWSVNMRPGRPLAFGAAEKTDSIAKTYLFGLPGNPVAMMISFYVFVRPALQLLAGATVTTPLLVGAVINQPITKKLGRTEFQRAVCVADDAGNLHVNSTGDQGSAMISSMSKANCLLVLESEQEKLVVGDRVKVLLFEGLF